MKNIFLPENFQFLEVKFSINMNRRIFVMNRNVYSFFLSKYIIWLKTYDDSRAIFKSHFRYLLHILALPLPRSMKKWHLTIPLASSCQHECVCKLLSKYNMAEDRRFPYFHTLWSRCYLGP